MPTTCVTWVDAPQIAVGPGLAFGLIFLVVTRALSMLNLSRREAWRKDAEILILRHQLAVALRQRPAFIRD